MSCRHKWTGFTSRCIFISELFVFLTYTNNPEHSIMEEHCRGRFRDMFHSRASCPVEGIEKRPRRKKSQEPVSAVNRKKRSMTQINI